MHIFVYMYVTAKMLNYYSYIVDHTKNVLNTSHIEAEHRRTTCFFTVKAFQKCLLSYRSSSVRPLLIAF